MAFGLDRDEMLREAAYERAERTERAERASIKGADELSSIRHELSEIRKLLKQLLEQPK